MSNSESTKEKNQTISESAEQTGDVVRSKSARTYKRGNDYSAVSPAVIKRFPRYFRYLRELLHHDILRISSSELSEMMGVTASQIRQDLNCFGGFGQQGYGYNVRYLYDKISDLLGVNAGFGAITFTTPEEHDKVIAFTSQLPHVISNAYVKSHTAVKQKGFSAGSYKDMTRVSKLNEKMWAELFFENKDNLCNEIEFLVERLQEYSAAHKANDKEALIELLKEGTDSKKQAK